MQSGKITTLDETKVLETFNDAVTQYYSLWEDFKLIAYMFHYYYEINMLVVSEYLHLLSYFRLI